MMNKKIIGVMALALVMIVGACPAFAATSASSTQQVKVEVLPTIAIEATWANGDANSTINLGALTADGIQKPFVGGAAGEQLYTYSNIAIDVYTRVNDTLMSGTNSIPLSNFLYSGGDIGTAKAFSTTYAKMKSNWDAAPQGSSREADINFYLTVPFGTAPGNYSNTLYFSAVNAGNATGATAP